MSKEFEEVVLKKLDELANGIKDNSQRLANLKEEQKYTNQRLEKVEIGLKENREDVIELRKDFIVLRKDFMVLSKDFVDLRQRFTVFDFEINRKIDTLFDSDTVNKENIVSLNVKNYNHDTRISNLENKDLSFANA